MISRVREVDRKITMESMVSTDYSFSEASLRCKAEEGGNRGIRLYSCLDRVTVPMMLVEKEAHLKTSFCSLETSVPDFEIKSANIAA